MNYKRLSIEELKKLKYPNLMAEFIESHYSICTVADHMGLGRRQEDDPVIWGKLNGTIEIFANEAAGLCRLFSIDFKYLFSDKLEMFSGKPIAVIRWKESNDRRERELQNNEVIWDIYRELKANRDLLETVKAELDLNREELELLRCIAIELKKKR